MLIIKRQKFKNFEQYTEESFVGIEDLSIRDHIIENSWHLLQLRMAHENTNIKTVTYKIKNLTI